MTELDTIRSRLSIEEVVGQYVQMKKIGRNYKGLCPFHQEKTPSFIISPDKGLAYCFGCRKGGDIFAFIQELEKVDFPGAVKMLAERAGVELPKQQTSPVRKEQKERAYELLEKAHDFFRSQLESSGSSQEYLANRGYDKKTYQRFGIGYAPDSFHQLSEFLEQQGYSGKEILDVGLASQKNIGDSNHYDRFRQRIMFPIHDAQGRLVAFGGRTLSTDPDAAKYLNSPETDYYHKGNTLFCFHLAKQAIRDKDHAVIVEGYFDALTAHLHGYPQTVASLGTALTEGQITLIGRFTKKLLFAFDADRSGQAAASRSIEIAQKMGYSVAIITIPSGKDPDEAIRTTPEAWQKALEMATDAMDYEFQKTFSQANASTLEGKKQVIGTLFPIIERLPSKVDQEFYLKKLSTELEVGLKNLVSDFERQTRHHRTPSAQTDQSPVSPSHHYSRWEYLLGLLLSHPTYLDSAKSLFNPDYLESEEQKNLYKNLFDHYNHAASKNEHLQLLELYAEERYATFSEEQLKAEVMNLCGAIRQDYKKRRLQDLRFKLTKRDQLQPLSASDQLMHEYQQLMADQF